MSKRFVSGIWRNWHSNRMRSSPALSGRRRDDVLPRWKPSSASSTARRIRCDRDLGFPVSDGIMGGAGAVGRIMEKGDDKYRLKKSAQNADLFPLAA